MVNTFSTTSAMPSFFSEIVAAPDDPIFKLTVAYIADLNPKKIDLGAGAYKDEQCCSWVLPSVRQAKALIAADPNDHHDYPMLSGRPQFRALAARTVLGLNSAAIAEARVASCQTISGTGANHLAGLFLRKFRPNAALYLPDPTWGNHHALYGHVGYTLKFYPYWNPETRALKFDGLMESMRNAPSGSIFLLHACAHNPTGTDPTPVQWQAILKVMLEKGHLALFDCAYQGFASGNLDQDAYAVRLFVDAGVEVLICQSFSKNLGIYGERCGALHIVCANSVTASVLTTHLADLTRSEISCAPGFGAKVAERVIGTPELAAQWELDLLTMSGRIKTMRQRLYAALQTLQTPGTWEHIIDQIGMFSYTGLNPAQCAALVSKSIYLAGNGRISVSGLNEANVDHFAQELDWVVRNVQ
ncbi:aspartate aminotransferase [Protomyces lactucae-debilis]|uniref:Aspartate aminotransferase n=1 Tax=Protomyces lactucae-debilis TaxID=2754530 RepID=A0A1Y2FDY2_PROLT|nr:aspartate aminotransferase [Protomyces lactucae-debilis]ORY81526.1 aspartate aminotransferase [Protomyces lactucae-debilis]